MKAYLFTHLILYAIALATIKREREPYSDGEMCFLVLLRIGAIWWTIWTIHLLLWDMP